MSDTQQPSYRALHQSGELQSRITVLESILKKCHLCPRACNVNRLQGEKGFCKTGNRAIVASYNAHFGEEAPLVGASGSGTIFFSNCNLGCVFCQNHTISQGNEGVEVDSGQLAAIMISLQKQGCHNINLVTPSHVVPMIVSALPAAIEKGLSVPLIFNTSGYDAIDTLKLLDGIIDIYMPDFKFWQKTAASRYAAAPDYPQRARESITEMYRQVGDLHMDELGIAVKGVLVRHLVMPGGLDQTRSILTFLASLSKNIYVNIMEQYRPLFQAEHFPPIDKPLSPTEYKQALSYAADIGLTRLEQSGLLRLLEKLAQTRQK